MFFPFFMRVIHAPARWVLGFYVIVDNVLPFLASAGTQGGGVAYGAHLGGFLGGLALGWGINRRSLLLRPTDFGAPGLSGGAAPPEGSLAALIEEGDYEEAATRYVALSTGETRWLLSERHSLMLGRWMAAKGHDRAALALFQRHLRDYPVGPGAADAHVGAGLLQLHAFSQPTAGLPAPGRGAGVRSEPRHRRVGAAGAGPDCCAPEVPVERPLAARGESPAAFDTRCIPATCVASRSNTAGILPRRALPDGRITCLGATLDFHHGLLVLLQPPGEGRGEGQWVATAVARLVQASL